MDRAYSGATIPGQCGPGINGNEEGLRIPRGSSITVTSPGHLLVGFLPFCRGAVGEFYSPSRLGKQISNKKMFPMFRIKAFLLFYLLYFPMTIRDNFK